MGLFSGPKANSLANIDPWLSSQSIHSHTHSVDAYRLAQEAIIAKQLPVSLEQLVYQRLNRYSKSDQQLLSVNFQKFVVHEISRDRYVVFLVLKGEPMMIEDDALFPSDALITKLRLMVG